MKDVSGSPAGKFNTAWTRCNCAASSGIHRSPLLREQNADSRNQRSRFLCRCPGPSGCTKGTTLRQHQGELGDSVLLRVRRRALPTDTNRSAVKLRALDILIAAWQDGCPLAGQEHFRELRLKLIKVLFSDPCQSDSPNGNKLRSLV